MSEPRSRLLSRKALEAENARLTALLDQAGIDAEAARDEAAEAREVALDASADLAASGRLVAELIASRARLHTVLETVPVGILLAEAPSGRILMGNRRLEELLGHPPILAADPSGYGGYTALHADGRAVAAGEWPLARIVARDCDQAQLEVHYLRPDGDRIWIAVSGEAIKDPQGATVGAVVVAVDIEDRKQAEAAQEILNRELSHRLKNTLTLVQSIAAQTLRNAPNLEVARESLAARLVALGHAHDALLAGHTESADVEILVRGPLALHAEDETRFRLDGPALAVRPSAALALGMLMHELATNAVKYGALSNRDGRVSVSWAVEGTDGSAALRLTWTESGGPPVTAPERQGFGSRLVARGLSGSVGGTDLRYHPDGVVCTLTAPLADLLPAV